MPPVAVTDLGVVAPRLDAGNAQPLVMIDFLVLVVQGLVGSLTVLAGWGKLETRNGGRGQIPEPDTFALRGKFAGAR